MKKLIKLINNTPYVGTVYSNYILWINPFDDKEWFSEKLVIK
ncbi:MAG TPA: hypothetical protein VIN08_02825 [Ohtaekwangia sp.]